MGLLGLTLVKKEKKKKTEIFPRAYNTRSVFSFRPDLFKLTAISSYRKQLSMNLLIFLTKYLTTRASFLSRIRKPGIVSQFRLSSRAFCFNGKIQDKIVCVR